VLQSAIAAVHPTPTSPAKNVSFTPSCHDPLESLLAVPDGRSEQGRDHPVAIVPALTAAATMAGAESCDTPGGGNTTAPKLQVVSIKIIN